MRRTSNLLMVCGLLVIGARVLSGCRSGCGPDEEPDNCGMCTESFQANEYRECESEAPGSYTPPPLDGGGQGHIVLEPSPNGDAGASDADAGPDATSADAGDAG